MRILIIATSTQPRRATEEIGTGRRPKLEYIELADQLKADYIDYGEAARTQPAFFRQVDERLKIDIFWAQDLAKKIKKGGYEIVLSMSERIGIPLSHFLERGIQHYVILNHPLSPAKLQLVKLFHTFDHPDKLLLLSNAERLALQKALDLKDSQLETVLYAVDTTFYYPIEHGPCEEIDPSRRFILSLGLSRRDYPTLIEAMRRLPAIRCEICATSAWDRFNLGIDRETLPSNVKMVDYDHPGLIRKAYSRCSFVVIPLDPTTSQWSSGSASVLQPQAIGKPVIATRLPGLCDYMLEGKTGFLVEGGNPAALADAIERLWAQPGVAEEMGRCAQDWVRANYSYQRWIEDIRRVIGV